MKTFRKIGLFALMLCAVVLVSCNGKDDEPDPEPEVVLPFLFGTNKDQIGDGKQEFEIKAVAGQSPTKYTLKKGTYLLQGWVYITDGVELTIEPGTIIKGDKDTKAALIVEPGGKLFAEGTKTEPIVFTSEMPAGQRKPGDWGGLILCGKGTHNQGESQIEGGPRTKYGGNVANDNSGVLKYVRVEFAGFPFEPDKEINGITFGAVGSATKVEYVQVSYSNDDSFEWFGGSADAKYLIAYHGWDDDFDADYGFSGKVQHGLIVRNPRLADISRSNGFESDNNGSGSTQTPFTSAVFSNITIIGPIGQDPQFLNNSTYITGGNLNPNNGSKLGQYQAAIQIRRNSKISIFNSVAVGYPVGLILENDRNSTTQTWFSTGESKVSNVYFAGMNHIGSDKNGSIDPVVFWDGTTEDKNKTPFSEAYFLREGGGNKTFGAIADLGFTQPNSLQPGANWMPKAGSPLLSGAAFTDTKLTGFDRVNHIGAFGGEDWTSGWANFNPQNTAY
ncbi:hypothetical protein [Petrimonas sp.]|uniref:hypothetical protein n=1 Tax=Petrimonas sp. TaxID=2023866 RepID=UPI003F51870A